MKSLLSGVAGASIAVVVAGVLALGPSPSRRVLAVRSTASSGDINGDGSLDLGDPIYLLNYLFASGPEPKACAQETDPRVDVLEDRLDQMSQALGMIPIDFCSRPEPSMQPSFRFETNMTDNTITDHVMGLMWAPAVPATQGLTWTEAGQYCDILRVGSYDDWRMPALEELAEFFRFGSSIIMMMPDDVKALWSGTSVAGADEMAWQLRSELADAAMRTWRWGFGRKACAEGDPWHQSAMGKSFASVWAVREIR